MSCIRADRRSENDPIQTLVGRLELNRYKATIRGLTKFGDRRQGTDRNRAAIDWIEAQLKSYGCTNTERVHYEYQPPPQGGRRGGAGAGGEAGRGRGGRGNQAGGVVRGERGPTAANNDPDLQPDARLRELNSQPSTPGPREEVFCTKVGTTHPEEMYIVAAHMDGIGFGEAANDDGSGTALVMEVARVLSSPDVSTERSIRFALWNNEETGLERRPRLRGAAKRPARARKTLPGPESIPEPKWLGMIQHDMLMFDHGMPGKTAR